MPSPKLAGRYAKCLLDFSIEKKQLEEVYGDAQVLQRICKTSRDFASLLRSPVIPESKKEKVFDAVVKDKIHALTLEFCKLLLKKSRESHLPEIIDTFIDQYKAYHGIYTLKLVTAVPVSEELKKVIVDKVIEVTPMKKIELVTEVKEEIIGGFVLEAKDIIADASMAFDLYKIRKQFEKNEYIYNIR